VALLFSLSMVLWLAWLGNPDGGVIIGTYLGYWFLGAALLSIAMVASLLTSSQTVAFILGALFCLVPVVLSRPGTSSAAAAGLDGRPRESGGVRGPDVGRRLDPGDASTSPP
jgi:ABC-2 type transport system permease protein